jgi:3-phosphoshikimate 1-carboxyvinyltransferase
MGASVELLGEGGSAPIRVGGRPLYGVNYAMPVASAQVKSCILLAALFAEGETVVIEPRPTRDHTERLMQVMDLPLRVAGPRVSLQGFGPGGPKPAPVDWYVPGDFSSAAFWLVAAAAADGRSLSVQNVGLNPRRTALLAVLERMGARISVQVVSDPDVAEPYGDIKVCGTALRGARVEGPEIPNLIDELPLVAVLGALACGETSIRDATELRVKESDRIAAMVANLRALGVEVEEHGDGMTVRGPASIRPTAPVCSFGDHRVAMAMAVLSLYAHDPVTIEDIACTETSYPGFWGDLKRLGAHVSF